MQVLFILATRLIVYRKWSVESNHCKKCSRILLKLSRVRLIQLAVFVMLWVVEPLFASCMRPTRDVGLDSDRIKHRIGHLVFDNGTDVEMSGPVRSK